MPSDEIHYNDIGTIFRGTIQDGSSVVDISGATTIQMLFNPPGGATRTKTATLTGDGTDGKMQYTTVDGDLNVLGVWQWQGQVVLPAGTWRTDVKTFVVHSNL